MACLNVGQSPMQPGHVVIWFKDEPTYLRFQNLCPDMTSSYDQWFKLATQQIPDLLSKAMELAHEGRQKVRTPPFNLDAANFSEPLTQATAPQMRALHAQCVKISREAYDREIC
jgi:hypothetical protein